ncbi:MAG: 1-acyl-sn-glycerol-3-phosphate acyltransferase [Rhodospirillales bacterium]|nr:1-acyl-sn-glycerol-3-phosphate acyltransferase [Rhodospirillales bacterium]MCW8951283.1 1-acyl-sn-glycerol-3-phosphate acyltransferase [Rhodospirillales bacterium]
MTALRSALFNVAFIIWTAMCILSLWVLLPFPRRVFHNGLKIWARGMLVLLRFIVGIRYEVRGRENIPPGAAIYACKHESTWETAIFFLLVEGPAYVLKEELTRIPLWGAYARKVNAIVVNRKGGASVLRSMAQKAESTLAGGQTVIIFPEGTRTAPGSTAPYHPGVAALARIEGFPVVPVALNSGIYWGRDFFLTRPGTIVIEFMPAMPADLPRKDFMKQLQSGIEEASERLRKEAEQSLGINGAGGGIRAESGGPQGG